MVHVLHITRFAQWLQNNNCSLDAPYLLTMGGTDVHVDFIGSSLPVRTIKVIEKASFITLFNEGARSIMERINKDWTEKLKVIPQGVMLPKLTRSTSPFSTATDPYHILLPAGLRRVKDVLHLLSAWIDLQQIFPQLKVTIMGEVLEDDVYKEVIEACSRYPFITYQAAVPFSDMGQWYEKANLVVNTSVEEGQPTAICEAMGLGVPVIARENAGNKSVITHGETGFLYEQPTEFVALVQQLIQNPEKQREMVEKAKVYIQTERSIQQEVTSYVQLFKRMI
jgi:glycosyltransferase involved in cell wall biosynthesis